RGDGIAHAVDMDVHQLRDLAEEVVVDGGHLDAALAERTEDLGDLGFGEHQVAHHVRLVPGLDEGQVGAEGKGRFQGDVPEMHAQVGAGKAVAMHAAVECGRGAAHGPVDGPPV